MDKLKRFFGNMIATAYFIFPMGIVIIILLFTPLMFLSDVSAIRNSGFAGPNANMSIIGLCGFVIGLSILIPVLRKMYAFFPMVIRLCKNILYRHGYFNDWNIDTKFRI